MKVLKALFVITFLLTYNLQYAQEADEQQLSLDGGSINSQFEYLIKKSGNYHAAGISYEVVKSFNISKLRKNVLDSINALNKKALELNATIGTQESSINSLNKKLEDTTHNLSSVTEEKDSMYFLGILVSKVTYNLILWTIIAGLLFLFLLFVYKFRRSNILTQEAKTSLSELEVEYEDHRRRALEREQRISRQLQDEINKYKKSK